jgi:hypothetical protein
MSPSLIYSLLSILYGGHKLEACNCIILFVLLQSNFPFIQIFYKEEEVTLTELLTAYFLLVTFLTYPSTLKIKPVRFSETSKNICHMSHPSSHALWQPQIQEIVYNSEVYAVAWKRMSTQCATVATENHAQQKGHPNRQVYTTEHRGPSGIPATYGRSRKLT